MKIHIPNITYQELSHKSRATFFAITLISDKCQKKRYFWNKSQDMKLSSGRSSKRDLCFLLQQSMCFKILSIYTSKTRNSWKCRRLVVTGNDGFWHKTIILKLRIYYIYIYFSTKNTKTRTVKLRFRYASRVNTLYLFNKNMDLVLIVTVYTL